MAILNRDLLLIDAEQAATVRLPLYTVISAIEKQSKGLIVCSLEDSALGLVRREKFGQLEIVFNGKLSPNKEKLDDFGKGGEGEWKKKLFSALFEAWTGIKIVVVGGEAARAVLERCDPTLRETPIVARLKASFPMRKLRLLSSHSTEKELFALFFSFQPIPPHPQLHFSYAKDVAARVTDSLLCAAKSDSEIFPFTAVEEVGKRMEMRCEAALDHLESSLIPAKKAFITRQKALKDHFSDIKSIKKSQIALLSLLERFSTQAATSLSTLHNQYSYLESQLAALQAELSSINPAYHSHSQPISIIFVGIGEQGVLEAEIWLKKPYKVIGNIAVFAANKPIFEKTVIITDPRHQYSFGIPGQFSPGLYQLKVTGERQDLLAAPFDFEITACVCSERTDSDVVVLTPMTQNWDFERSFVYTNVQNMREIESYLREKFGDFRVEQLREVAFLWKNESISGVNTLLEVFAEADLPQPPFLYPYLESKGLYFK